MNDEDLAMMPKEPTAEMLAAGKRVPFWTPASGFDETPRDIWRAMFAAYLASVPEQSA